MRAAALSRTCHALALVAVDRHRAPAALAHPTRQVVRATRLKDNDHIATCKDGNRYRVFVNAEGRVVAQKQ